MKYFILALRVIVAIILLQTLYFKFTAAPESVFIFSTLGMEPWGRIGSGIGELIASILILIPATQALGALLVIGILSGALMSHLLVLGIEVQGDGGLLFGLALAATTSSVLILIENRKQIFKLIDCLKATLKRGQS